jgi:hypothetical protein
MMGHRRFGSAFAKSAARQITATVELRGDTQTYWIAEGVQHLWQRQTFRVGMMEFSHDFGDLSILA